MSARWSDRQQAMLREMGVTLWLPPTPAEVPVPEAAMPEPVPAAVAVPVPVQAPVPSPAPAPVRMSRPAAVSTEPDPPSVPRPLAARPSGVAAMDWPALREAVAGCEACGLCRSRRNTVFGVGHEQAQWMIVGEAPGDGASEDPGAVGPVGEQPVRPRRSKAARMRMIRRGEVFTGTI